MIHDLRPTNTLSSLQTADRKQPLKKALEGEFKLLLAQYLEHQRSTSFSLIFVPIFLLEGFGVCGCCALNLVISLRHYMNVS